MNDEELFWQGIDLYKTEQTLPVTPEFRAYYNNSGVVTHYTALDFATEPTNFIVVTESDYASRDSKQMQVKDGKLIAWVRPTTMHEFRLKNPRPGFTSNPVHANILYHDSD